MVTKTSQQPNSSHLLSFLLLAALCLLLFPTKGSAQTPPGRIEVEFWHAMGSDQGRMVNELSDQFNKAQTTYQIKPIYQGNYNALSQKLIASLYAKRNPAISQMYPGWTTRYYRYGYLEPVASFVKDDPAYAEELKDFFDVMIEENTLKNPKTGELELVTLPFNKSVYVLFVNQTRLEAAGWSHPPRTWDEFYKLAKEITIRPEGSETPSFYGFAARGNVEDITVQALSAGLHLVDEESGTINVDSENGLKAMEFLQQMVGGSDGQQIGYVEPGYLSNVFGSERIAMYISSTAAFTFNDRSVGNKFIWRAYPVPSLTADQPARTLMQGTNMGIYRNVPPEVQKGAWEFMKFMCSPEINSQWAIATGYMPVRRATLKVPKFAEHLENDIRYSNAIGTLDSATFEPRVMYWESVRQIMSRQVESVVLGRKTSAEAMKDARREIKAVQDQAL